MGPGSHRPRSGAPDRADRRAPTTLVRIRCALDWPMRVGIRRRGVLDSKFPLGGVRGTLPG